MVAILTDEQILDEAKKRVKAKKDFYNHVITYIGVNAVLILIWALSGDAARQTANSGDWTGNRWFLWPLTIWGAFVVLHGLRVFLFERKSDVGAIAKEVEKIKKEHA